MSHELSNTFFPSNGCVTLGSGRAASRRYPEQAPPQKEFIEYKTSMITDEDPLRGLLFY